MALTDEQVRQVGTNETSAARNQNSHVKTLARVHTFVRQARMSKPHSLMPPDSKLSPRRGRLAKFLLGPRGIFPVELRPSVEGITGRFEGDAVTSSLGPVDLLHVAFGGLGGHETVIRQFDISLRDTQIRSAVVAVTPPEEVSAHWTSDSLVRVVGAYPWRGGQGNREFNRSLEILRPRVVLAHTHATSLEILARLKIAGNGTSLVLREGHASNLRSPFDNARSLMNLIPAGAVVHLTQSGRDTYPLSRLSSLLRKPRVVIPNPVGLSDWREGPTANAHSERRFIIGTASRLVPGKRLDVLLRAMQEARAAGMNIHVRMAGDGPDLPSLRELTIELGLEHYVEMCGRIDSPSMGDFLRGLDAFVHLSDGEGQSNAILEAASIGLPIIATDAVALRECFTNNESILLVDNDTQSIVRALNTLDRDRRARVGLLAQKHIREHHDPHLVVAAYLDVFSSVDGWHMWSESAQQLRNRVM